MESCLLLAQVMHMSLLTKISVACQNILNYQVDSTESMDGEDSWQNIVKRGREKSTLLLALYFPKAPILWPAGCLWITLFRGNWVYLVYQWHCHIKRCWLIFFWSTMLLPFPTWIKSTITTVLEGKQNLLLCLYHTPTSTVMLELSLVKAMQGNLRKLFLLKYLFHLCTYWPSFCTDLPKPQPGRCFLNLRH